jgi:nicotinamide-nucleotide amidase
MQAEIIAIGAELLRGDIVESNASYLARALLELGIDLSRTSIVGDDVQQIAQAIGESVARCPLIFTTGGLGPTVDDVTREGISLTAGAALEFQPALWQQIVEIFARYDRQPTENNRRQAYIPHGALPFQNRVGTAPAFLITYGNATIIALPGVPHEMMAFMQNDILPYLRTRFRSEETILNLSVRTAGVGESWVDERISGISTEKGAIIGLAAHPGRVDVHITARARSTAAAQDILDRMQTAIVECLGDAVYGVGDETLEEVVLHILRRRHLALVVLEVGTGGALSAALAPHGEPFKAGIVLPGPLGKPEIERLMRQSQKSFEAQVALSVVLRPEPKGHQVTCLLHAPDKQERLERVYGGPSGSSSAWATSVALNLLRRRFGRDSMHHA